MNGPPDHVTDRLDFVIAPRAGDAASAGTPSDSRKVAAATRADNRLIGLLT